MPLSILLFLVKKTLSPLPSRTAVLSCACSGTAAVLLAKHWSPTWDRPVWQEEPGTYTLHATSREPDRARVLLRSLPSSRQTPLDAVTSAFENVRAYSFLTIPWGQAANSFANRRHHHPILQNYKKEDPARPTGLKFRVS